MIDPSIAQVAAEQPIAVPVEAARRARKGRKQSARSIAIDQAFEKARPINWDGKDAWTEAGRVESKMQRELEKRSPKIKCIGQRAIYDRLIVSHKD